MSDISYNLYAETKKTLISETEGLHTRPETGETTSNKSDFWGVQTHLTKWKAQGAAFSKTNFARKKRFFRAEHNQKTDS